MVLSGSTGPIGLGAKGLIGSSELGITGPFAAIFFCILSKKLPWGWTNSVLGAKAVSAVSLATGRSKPRLAI